MLHGGVTSAVIAMSLAGSVVPALAANETKTVAGGETTFIKYVVFDDEAKAPEATFSFSVSAGAAVDATSTTEKIYAGVGTPTIADVTFSADDTVYLQAGDDDHIELADGKAFAKHDVTVDFSSVTFSHAGVYHYVISEDASDILGITNDDAQERDMYVYVTSAEDGTLSVASYVMMERDDDRALDLTAVEKDGDTIVGKSYEYTNEYATSNLTFSKSVAGNKADHTKYFAVTVTISDAVEGTKINVVGAGTTFDAAPAANDATAYDADTMLAGNTVADNVLVVGEDGTVTHTFYLQHGQSVELDGLANGTKWHVEEAQEDYTPSSTVTADENDAGIDELEGENGREDVQSGITGDVTVALKNTKEGTIPTGVMTFIGTGAAVTLLAAGGFAAGVIGKKKRSDEE